MTLRHSRLFFYGEKKEGENLGFQCQQNLISELKELETFDQSWKTDNVAGIDSVRGLIHEKVAQTKIEYEEIISRINYLVSGRSHVFIVTTDNELYCCGYNSYLQCGCGNNTASIPYFVKIDMGSVVAPLIEQGLVGTDFKITKIACGWVHSVIVINDKYLFGAGHNFFYQTGISSSGTFGTLTYIPLDHLSLHPNYKITHIDGGTFFTVFAVNNRNLYGAGSSCLTNFGIKQNDNVKQYMFVHKFDCDISKIQSGYDHTLVLLKDNRIFLTGKLEGCSSSIEGFQQLEFNYSIQDSIDIAVCRFNYKSYVLKNDNLYQITNGRPEFVKKDVKYANGFLYTSNLSLMVVDSTGEHIDTRNNSGEKVFDLEIPQGFKVDHISAGYTAANEFFNSICGQSINLPCSSIQKALNSLDFILNQNYSAYLADTLTPRAVSANFIILTDLKECYSQIVTNTRENLVYNIIFQSMDGADNLVPFECDKISFFPIIGNHPETSRYRKDIQLVVFKGLSLVLNHRGCQGYNFLFFDVSFDHLFLMINFNLFCHGLESEGDYILIERSEYKETDESMSGLIVHEYSQVYWIGLVLNAASSGIMFSNVVKFGIFQSKIEYGDLIFNTITNLHVSGSMLTSLRFLATKIDQILIESSEFTKYQDFSAIMADFGTSIEIKNVKGTNGESFASIQGFATVSIDNLRLENNIITEGSQNILGIEQSYEVFITNSVFLNNKGLNGSSLFMDRILRLVINKCSFLGGVSQYDGGAILIQSFSRNYVSGMGSITNCIFENNTALYGYGGAIYIGVAYSLNLISNQFKNNKAYIGGGAVFIDDLIMQFQYSGSVFDGNRVMVVDHENNAGGAILIAKLRFSSPNRVEDTLWKSATFINNFAKRGGAIAFLPQSPLTYGRFIKTKFINNQALLSGAAVYIIGSEPYDKENEFIGNMVLETNSTNNVSYPIKTFESMMEKNELKVLTPGTEFTFKMKGVDYEGNEIPLNYELIRIVSENPTILFKTTIVGKNTYSVIPYLLVNETFYENYSEIVEQQEIGEQWMVKISFYFQVPLLNEKYNDTVYISNCKKGYHIQMVPGNVGEYLYACVKDPNSYIELIIGIVVPVSIVAFIMGSLIAWFVILVFRKIIMSLKRLREKDRAEEELERKLNDKKVIFDLSDEESENYSKSSKKTSTGISTRGGDLYIPLLEANENQNFIIPIEDLKIEKKIGEGGNGVVYLGKWRSIKVAIKSIKSLEITDKVDEFDKEAGILSRLHHLNIVQFYGVAITKQNKYMITEYLTKGSLDQAIYQCKNNILKLSFSLRLSILLDVANGMDYLHNMKPAIIHRDLKPGNILLNDHYQGKVCDFGLVRLVRNTIQSTMTMNIGTLMYLAPEAIDDSTIPKLEKNSLNIATKLDVYSFSIIMYEILFCIIPFIENPLSDDIQKDVTTYKIPFLVSQGNRPFILKNREEIKKWYSFEDSNMYKVEGNNQDEIIIDILERYQNLMIRCWNQSPLERPSFSDVLSELSSLSKLFLSK